MASKMRKANELANLVMDALWDLARPASSNEIHSHLVRAHDLALTTVLTVLNRLEKKGLVKIDRLEGRKLQFQATRTREEHAAKELITILNNAQNPRLALNFFTAALSKEMLEFLKKDLEDED